MFFQDIQQQSSNNCYEFCYIEKCLSTTLYGTYHFKDVCSNEYLKL